MAPIVLMLTHWMLMRELAAVAGDHPRANAISDAIAPLVYDDTVTVNAPVLIDLPVADHRAYLDLYTAAAALCGAPAMVA